MRLKSAAEQRRFVRQVQRAGAVGIGFGVGLTHDAVPPALIAEANRWGLPVVEVPYETPFIAIGKLVADAQSADHLVKLERLIAGHQILARALLTGGGLAELLKHLGSMLRTEIVLTQFTAQLYNSVAGHPAPKAEGWASYPDPHGPPRRLHPVGEAAVRGLGHRGLRPKPDQRRAQQHGQAAAGPAGAGRARSSTTLSTGRWRRQRSHPAPRRRRHQQHPQERGPARRIGRPPQTARESSLPQPLEAAVERRRREGPRGGGARRRQRRQRPGPQPQRPPGRGRDPRHDRHRRGVHQAQRPALELFRGPRRGQPRPAGQRARAAEPDLAAAGQRGRSAGGHGQRIAEPAAGLRRGARRRTHGHAGKLPRATTARWRPSPRN